MKAFPRLALAACLLPTAAFATNDGEIDAYRQLIRFRAGQVGLQEALAHTNGQLMQHLQVDSSSPYSDVVSNPDVANTEWWLEFVEKLSPTDYHLPLTVLQWDLGLTRARPGLDIPEAVLGADIERAFRNRDVATNARKADVDADIFWKALDMTSNRYSTAAANYAVALQILRDQLRTTPPSEYGRLAIKREVFDRYMSASSPQTITPYDQRYLSALLTTAVSTWSPGGTASTGLRQLPAVYRVARVAAAYRDAQGYVNAGTCLADGSPGASAGTGRDGDDRPLCFVAATDRAVHRWYRREMRLQNDGFLPNQHTHNGWHIAFSALFDVLAVMDFAAFAEVSEAAIAADLAEEGAIGIEDADYAEERSNRLVCGVRS